MKWQHGALVAIGAAVVITSISLSPMMRVDPDATSASVPAISAATLDGKSLPLNKFDGKPLIVDFWATWCGPCRYAMPHLNALQQRHADAGLHVLGISVDEIEPERVRKFADGLGVEFQIAMATPEVLDAYGPLTALPTTYFISREGEVVRKVVGYIGEETLEAYAQEILK